MPDIKTTSFRTQFSGFNKEDVNNFIELMNNEYVESENNYKKIISENEKRLDEANVKICELEKRLASLTESSDKLKSELDETNAMYKEYIDRMEKENVDVREKYSELRNTFEKSQEELAVQSERAEKAEKENVILYAAKTELERKNSELISRFDSESEENALLCEKIKTLNSSREESEAREIEYKKKESEYLSVISSLEEKLNSVSAERSSLNSLLSEKNRELEEILPQFDQVKEELHNALSELKNRGCSERQCAAVHVPPASNDQVNESEKARIYDKVSYQLGSILIDAREIADGIISDANREADKMIADAKFESEAIHAETDERIKRSLLYINQTMKRMSSECMSEYIRYINDTRASFDRLIEENSSKEREVFKKFASIAENSCAILESGIDKITKKAEKD